MKSGSNLLALSTDWIWNLVQQLVLTMTVGALIYASGAAFLFGQQVMGETAIGNFCRIGIIIGGLTGTLHYLRLPKPGFAALSGGCVSLVYWLVTNGYAVLQGQMYV